VASRYGSFPILVETYRECLADVFDLPALRDVLRGIERREVAVHRVETPRATPFASSLLFDYVAAYMYEGDAPLAERRAQALALDRDLLRELPARRSCGSCWTRTPWRRRSSSGRLSSTTARPAPSTRWPTSCAAWGTSRPTRSRRGPGAGRRPPGSGWRRSPQPGGRSRSGSPVNLAGSRSRMPPATARGRAPSRRPGRPWLPRRYPRRVGGLWPAGPTTGRPGDRPARRWACPRGSWKRHRHGWSARDAAAGRVPGRASPRREWCDRRAEPPRRRFPGRLRREVEPVEPAALARFLLLAGRGRGPGAGHRGGRRRPALRGQAALELSQGRRPACVALPIPVGPGADVLAARIPAPAAAPRLSWARSARWAGWAAARWAATTAIAPLFRPGPGRDPPSGGARRGQRVGGAAGGSAMRPSGAGSAGGASKLLPRRCSAAAGGGSTGRSSTRCGPGLGRRGTN